MSDETNYGTNAPGDPGAPAGTAGTAERVGFCQDCGTPLTRETARPVGAGVFCEPCLAARVGTGGTQGGYTTVPPVGSVPPGTVPPMGNMPGSLPHPVLAGFLGIIPGVGAIYNAQYAKGIAHLVIFMVLSSLGHMNDVFKLLCVVWFFYQIIDAYQTARARLEGRPLPNPFGLNDIGERMGFGRQPAPATGTAAPNAGAAGQPAGATWTGDPVNAGPVNAGPTSYGTQGYASTPYTAPGYTPASGGRDWVGYVPPANFTAAPPVPPMGTSTSGSTWGQAPYAPAYTGHDVPNPYTATPVMPSTRRFPVGAIWLIGLGVLFLLFEFGQDWGWSLNFNWVLAVLFAGLAALSLARKLHTGVNVVCILRWPLVSGVLALLFLLQAIDVAPLGRTWPILFIVFGAMLIVERTALANMNYSAPVYPVSGSVVPPMDEAEAERARAAWATAAEPGSTESHTTDLTKGGQ